MSLTRLIGEQSGLSALADKSSIVRRHDPFAPAGVGDTVVEAYAPWGFTVSGAALEGPVLLLPRAAFLFSPQQPDHLTPEALAVLDLLDQPVSLERAAALDGHNIAVLADADPALIALDGEG